VAVDRRSFLSGLGVAGVAATTRGYASANEQQPRAATHKT